jgi:hypothetical protein
MRTITIGDKLVSADFLVINNSVCIQQLYFWDDTNATVPSDLSTVTSATLEVRVDSTTLLVWTGSIVSNQVTFNLTAAQTTLAWDARPYNLVFIKATNRYVVLSGEVRVQR